MAGMIIGAGILIYSVFVIIYKIRKIRRGEFCSCKNASCSGCTKCKK